ncbi:MAG: hypothetical protein HZB26_25490 [Candidatus Hydrogenedentes bacterium]|nr:hypothetical protein [Candidatus Hydrogenedentota bacterium]
MGFFLVLKAEVVRGMIQMRRYWFASVVGLVVGYVTLIGMVYAFVQTPGLVGVGGQVTDMSVGFLIGMFAFGILGLFSQNLQAMASAGQLEQVCMSPHGLVTNFLARSLGARLVLGWITATVASVAGLYASYALDLPTGAAIVCALGGALLISGLVSGNCSSWLLRSTRLFLKTCLGPLKLSCAFFREVTRRFASSWRSWTEWDGKSWVRSTSSF